MCPYLPNRKILTASLAPCVHVAGAINFGNIASLLGFLVKFLGPARKANEIVDEIVKWNPDIVGLSYRLTPANVRPLLEDFFAIYDTIDPKPTRLYFAGTPPVVTVAKEFGRFDYYFEGGESSNLIIRVLKNEQCNAQQLSVCPMELMARIQWKQPFPLLRAHFGLPSIADTIHGINDIARADVLDVISIAPDQEAQENFFHPESQNQVLKGAGGVPIRTREDLQALHDARLNGNFPLLRIYAGTQDFIRFADLVHETIQNAWAAIPLFWFNKMDGRGPLSLVDSIEQHIDVIKWHAERGIPVEINDPHHWGLRDAPDSIVVADSFLCAQLAKSLGVRYYIAQYMFNAPPNSSIKMDLAKMLAMAELNSTLETENFKVIRQVRTGLASMPLHLNRAKGQLALSTTYQMALRPQIVHVVTHSEALHAAQSQEIIESCEIVNQIITRSLEGLPDPSQDPLVKKRKQQLIEEVQHIFQAINSLARTLGISDDKPIIVQKDLLDKIVTSGLFDAPHLVNNEFALGRIHTRIIDGACVTYDPIRDKVIPEEERIATVLEQFTSGNKPPHAPSLLQRDGGGIQR